MDVLVDPERLLLLPGPDFGATESPVTTSLRPADEPSGADARHVAEHPRQIEIMVQRRDTVGDIEGPVLEREMLRVCLYTRKRAVERAAAEAHLLVDEDVRRDVLAVAFPPKRRPRLSAAPTSSTR